MPIMKLSSLVCGPKRIATRRTADDAGTYWVVAVQESDGNDASWTDWIVDAPTREAAISKVCDTIEAQNPGGEWDGNDPGSYEITIEPDDLPEEDQADYDSGDYDFSMYSWTVNEPEGPYVNESEAESNSASYHSKAYASCRKTAEYFADKSRGFLEIYLWGEVGAGKFRVISIGDVDVSPNDARGVAADLIALADLAESGEDLPVIQVSR